MAEKMGITVEKNAHETKVAEAGALSWPKWPETIPVSKFPWTFEKHEKVYFLTGKVRVYPEGEHADNEFVEVSAGDLAYFPKGLKCTWDVLEPINKHYYNYD